MKLLPSSLWGSAAFVASAAAAQALLYTSEYSPASNQGAPSISPVTARLLLAQRLGLSQYHSLEDADEFTLDILNQYGGQQPQVFEDEEQRRGVEKLLLIIENVDYPEDIFDSSFSPVVSIHDPPSFFENRELVSSLLEQAIHMKKEKRMSGSMRFEENFLGGGVAASDMSLRSLKLLNDKFPSAKAKLSDYRTSYEESDYPAIKSIGSKLSDYTRLHESARLGGLEHTTILHFRAQLQKRKVRDHDSALSELRAFIEYFHKPNGPISSTIIIMPSGQNIRKRATSPYGTYTTLLSTRQQQQPEEPLTRPSSPSANQPSVPEVLQASSSPLPHGVLPVCHSTLEAAITTTNNCSGHGTAYKKSGGETACYACKCSKTVLTDDEGGTKTTYWGGPACQKKDISVPFFLLAGLSIALVGAATWGIGLMASIGQEELPSVIGAGVAGPRAQK